MNAPAPIDPEKVSSPRFAVVDVGIVFGLAECPRWTVYDMQGAGGLGVELCSCDADQTTARENCDRIAYALNTIGRLLGDPAAPYFVDDVERLAVALKAVSSQSTLRSMQALGLGEREVATLFGAEAAAIGAGADMLRRMMAELLKFALVGDTVDEQARAWLDAAYPSLSTSTFETLTASDFMGRLLSAWKMGRIGFMSSGTRFYSEAQRLQAVEAIRARFSDGSPTIQTVAAKPGEVVDIVAVALGFVRAEP